MGIFDFFKKTQDNIPRGGYSGNTIYHNWQDAFIPLATIMSYYRSSAKFALTVNANMHYAVGDGYYLQASSDTMAQKNLELIEAYCQEINLDKLAQNLAIELYACGNCFLFREESGKLIHFPAEQVEDIYHDDGEPTAYRITHRTHGEHQTVQSFEEEIKPNQIIHFTRNKLAGSPWGRGIGHSYCAQGVGYKNAKGKYIYRLSYAQIDEMLEDALSKLAYRGLPRFFVNTMGLTKPEATEFANQLDSLDINEHFVNVGDESTTVNNMELGSRSNWSDFLQILRHASSWAMQSPVPTLFADPSNFSYASSQTSKELMFPDMDSFQRSFKTFIEQEIFQPYINKMSSHSWEKYPVEINWGKEETTDLDNITKLWEMKMHGMKITEKSIIDMLKKSGYAIEEIKSKVDPNVKAMAAKKAEPIDPEKKITEKLDRVLDDILDENK